jgi:hypothetical protein
MNRAEQLMRHSPDKSWNIGMVMHRALKVIKTISTKFRLLNSKCRHTQLKQGRRLVFMAPIREDACSFDAATFPINSGTVTGQGYISRVTFRLNTFRGHEISTSGTYLTV